MALPPDKIGNLRNNSSNNKGSVKQLVVQL
jgi:hypothetical protein